MQFSGIGKRPNGTQHDIRDQKIEESGQALDSHRLSSLQIS